MKIYNADEVTITIAGIPIHKTKGYADGEFLRIEDDTDTVLDVVGTDGEVTASLSNDSRAIATIILMSSSDSNDLLSALHARQKASKLRQSIGAFQVKDNSGRALYSAPACWIRKAPNASFDRTATPREWVVRIANITRQDNGNVTSV